MELIMHMFLRLTRKTFFLWIWLVIGVLLRDWVMVRFVDVWYLQIGGSSSYDGWRILQFQSASWWKEWLFCNGNGWKGKFSIQTDILDIPGWQLFQRWRCFKLFQVNYHFSPTLLKLSILVIIFGLLRQVIPGGKCQGLARMSAKRWNHAYAKEI